MSMSEMYRLVIGTLVISIFAAKHFLPSKVVVLEDEESSKRVPAVSGLLAYRKDIQSLHIRMNDSWKALPVEETVHIEI